MIRSFTSFLTFLLPLTLHTSEAKAQIQGENIASSNPLSLRLSQPAYTNFGARQNLSPFFPNGQRPTLQQWKHQRDELRRQWLQVLGNPSFSDYDKTATLLDTFEQPDFKGSILRQPTGPHTRQLVLIMEPKSVLLSPRPGVVIPFYHPDSMAGFDLQKRQPLTNRVTTQFGRHLVQQGYLVVCTEAFPYNTVPEPEKNVGLSWWRVAADKLLKDNPNWTGMGKLVHDTSRAVDLLLRQPNIDPDRVAVIGHSLGGKMAFYTACLDDRIKATIANDFGIGWDFTNWKDPWYLGEQILADDFTLAHHQLLALHAPRPFLLIAGQYDKPESWPYLMEAQKVYALYDRKLAVGMLDHASGHAPTPEAMEQAYQWLAEQFHLPPQR